MNTIDIILGASFVILLAIVAIRIWLGRKTPIDNDSGVRIKQPQVKSPDLERNLKNSPEEAIAEAEKKQQQEVTEQVASQSYGNVQGNQGAEPNLNLEGEGQTFSSVESIDPLVLIKTFSAPTDKRIDAMMEAGLSKMVEAVPALVEALYEPDSLISAAAAAALGKIGDPRAIEPMLEISRRNDAHLMKEMTESRDEEAPEENDYNGESVDSNSESPYNFKEMVIFKIDQLPKEYFQSDGSPIPRKDLVVKGLKDNNQQLRQMAAKAAIGLDSEEVIEPLITALENPYEVESVRFMAAEALGWMDNEKSVDSLLKALKDENVAVRYSAAAALSNRREDRVVMALIGATSDPDKYVKSSVVYALGASGNKQALNVLFDCMSDESEVVRFSAAKAIACFGSEEVVKETKSRLDYANKTTKLSLMEVLGQLEDEESSKILRGYLKEEDIEISYKASMILMGQENFEILDELIEASARFDEELFRIMKNNGNFPKAANGREPRNEAAKNHLSPASKSSHSNVPGSSVLSESLLKLRDGLLNENPNIRGSSANALGDYKEPQVVDLLLSVIDDENEFVRASAINSLGRVRAEKSLNSLLMKESDHSEEVRYALVKALAKFSNQSALLCLQKMAKSDPSNQVKRAARTALDKK